MLNDPPRVASDGQSPPPPPPQSADDIALAVGYGERTRTERSSPAPASGRSRYLPSMLAILLLLLMMLIVPPFVGRVAYYIARGRQDAAREELQELTPTAFSNTSRLVAQAIERSVVFISTRSMNRDEAARAVPEAAGQGSGVIIDEAGYILTNFHVVLGASHIVVHLADGRTELADVVGVDEYSDLAVLKIDAENLMAAKWGNSDDLEPGDPVWAIGSPYGLDNSVTFGIVSAKGRNGIGATRYQDLLQTDAAVNPGNSGGALVSAKGELVGINTAIMGSAFRGISFAIPSNMAREVFGRLQADGEVPRGWLGVRLDRLSPAAAKSAGIEEGRGVVIIEVLGGSPALAAGLEPDDIVVKWQGQPVEDPRRFSFLVAETAPATNAEIEVIRDGVALALEVEVGRLPRRVR